MAGQAASWPFPWSLYCDFDGGEGPVSALSAARLCRLSLLTCSVSSERLILSHQISDGTLLVHLQPFLI